MLRRGRRTAVPTIALAAAVAPAIAAPPPAHAATNDRVERGVVRLINAKRHREGKRALRLNRRMSVVASRHSAAMARTNTAAHGASWYSRVSRSARTKTVGEVIAYVHAPASMQARWVFNAWMHSPTHRAVIMSGRFDRAGIGRQRGRGMTYFTLDTAR